MAGGDCGKKAKRDSGRRAGIQIRLSQPESGPPPSISRNPLTSRRIPANPGESRGFRRIPRIPGNPDPHVAVQRRGTSGIRGSPREAAGRHPLPRPADFPPPMGFGLRRAPPERCAVETPRARVVERSACGVGSRASSVPGRGADGEQGPPFASGASASAPRRSGRHEMVLSVDAGTTCTYDRPADEDALRIMHRTAFAEAADPPAPGAARGSPWNLRAVCRRRRGAAKAPIRRRRRRVPA